MSAVDVGVLATLVLFAFPVLIAAALFTLLVSVEVPKLLGKEQIQSAIELQLVSHEAKWSLSEDRVPWPGLQVEWAAVAGVVVILASVASVVSDPVLRDAWFIIGIVNCAVMFVSPLYLYLFARRSVLRFVRNQIVSRLTLIGRMEALLVKRLSRLGGRIETLYSEVSLKTSIQVAAVARHILIERASGAATDATHRLERTISTLRLFSTHVGEHLESYRQLTRDFEFTKNLIIDRGSATLLGELDRIKEELTSDEMRTFFDRARWLHLEAKLDQLAFDLKMLRNIAEGGNDLPVSLGQACQTLNVTTTTSLKTAKTVVDALRRVWHPDTGISEEDRERRTIKTAQINVAWEIFASAFDESKEIAVKPLRTLELA
ncbi:MAG TPA: hypothetical protein VNR41_00850 [Xanthobacteraceae bacterium]|nr:hypothetical protein [Xanthobacteraceae bacterium]